MCASRQNAEGPCRSLTSSLELVWDHLSAYLCRSLPLRCWPPRPLVPVCRAAENYISEPPPGLGLTIIQQTHFSSYTNNHRTRISTTQALSFSSHPTHLFNVMSAGGVYINENYSEPMAPQHNFANNFDLDNPNQAMSVYARYVLSLTLLIKQPC